MDAEARACVHTIDLRPTHTTMFTCPLGQVLASILLYSNLLCRMSYACHMEATVA